MRQITFGPTTHFGESQIRVQDDEDNDDFYSLINDQQATNQIAYERANSQTSQQRTLNDVVFFAGENLFRESQFGHKEMAMQKYCRCKFVLDCSRTYQSYIYEFCGLLNIPFKSVKFFIGNKEVALMRQIRKPVEIEVQNFVDISKPETNSLKPDYQTLLTKSQYFDIEIIVNGQSIKAHKCILIARSDKFKAMLSSHMKEELENKIIVNNPSVSFQVYFAMIQWIYYGECDIPEKVLDQIALLNLTDEYLLLDLQKVCEDQIIDSLDGIGALEVLTSPDQMLPAGSENIIKEAAKSALLDDYEKVEELVPDIEEKISKVKGLMSQLFLYKKKKQKLKKRRRFSLGADDVQKKKVRFNVSSTIYEEASAIHDESDSMIEPLSIYSNMSPPGELNEEMLVSSTHSSIHVAERRQSAQDTQSMRNSEINAQMNSARPIVRPQSAGVNGQGVLRSNSTANLRSSLNEEENNVQVNENAETNVQTIFRYPSNHHMNRSLI